MGEIVVMVVGVVVMLHHSIVRIEAAPWINRAMVVVRRSLHPSYSETKLVVGDAEPFRHLGRVIMNV